MFINLKTLAKLCGVTLMIASISACSLFGATGTPRQMAEARAVHAFDKNRAPFGQRIALAQATYRPRVYGLNPYFGR